MDYNQSIIQWLAAQNIRTYYGCSGGGVLQLLKYLTPGHNAHHQPCFHYLSEYAAGYAPIGHYLASGHIACCVATTGAAEKLVASGASDARFMSIPALYLMGLPSQDNLNTYPIQDVSPQGMHIIEQFRSEFKDDVIHLDSLDQIDSNLQKIAAILEQKRPAIVFFQPEILGAANQKTLTSAKQPSPSSPIENVDKLITVLMQTPNNHIIVNPCTEAIAHGVKPETFRAFVEKIHAQVIYPVNGDNIATQTLSQNLGHIHLGCNQAAYNAWQQLTNQDILITLGADVGEYHLNLQPYPPCQSFCLTQYNGHYGQINGNYKHVFPGDYTQIQGNIESTLQLFLARSKDLHFPQRPLFPNPKDQHDTPSKPRAGYVDLVKFYQQLDTLWQPHSIAFEDVCIAYRDRQAILKQPNPHVNILTANHGSAMGGAFGMGVGAARANPHQRVFVFSGDGCFRLYGGNFAEAKDLHLVVCIMNNSTLSIIRDGCSHIIGDKPQQYNHARIESIDWQQIAGGFGWRYFKIKPDLTNLSLAMQAAYDHQPGAILIDLPVDDQQVLGHNFRYTQLKNHGNL